MPRKQVESIITIGDDPTELTLVMDNGREIEVDVTTLLHIPDTHDEYMDMASTAAEDYAFWAYHASRARRRKDAAKRKLETTLASTDSAYRAVIDGGQTTEARLYNWSSKDFGLITRQVDADPQVQDCRDRLSDREQQYEILRSIAEAVRQRNQLLTAALKGARNF